MRAAFLIATLLVSIPLAASNVFLRGGAGWDRSEATVLRDRDCSSTQPPALFGCGFEARGEFADANRWEIAIGIEWTSRVRVELAFSHRDLDLAAGANFTGVSGGQPVTASGSSRSALIIGTIDLGRANWSVRPFVTAGAGAARNEIGKITFAFPGIAPDAVTIIRGGAHTSFTWMAGLGATIPLTESLHLDLAVRHHDSGTVRTDAGPATIVRPRGTLVLDIDSTGARVRSTGAMFSVRFRL